MDVQEDENGAFMVKWKTAGIVSMLGLIPIALTVHGAYVGYHTEHVKQVIEPVLAQHSNDVELRIETAQHTANETQRQVKQLATQVSSLQVSASIAAVSALQTELDRHERNPENSESWQRERDRLKRQVEQAKEYRECLIDLRSNCDLLRGW